jgi:hypothetical protein
MSILAGTERVETGKASRTLGDLSFFAPLKGEGKQLAFQAFQSFGSDDAPLEET